MRLRFLPFLKHKLLTGISCFVFLVFNQHVNSQESVSLTLKDVLEIGGANNLTIKEYDARIDLAKAQVTKSKEWWLPTVFGGVQTNQLFGAAMNGNGNFFLDVNRNNLWLGLGLNANWDIAEGIFSLKSSHLNSQAREYESQAVRNQILLKSVHAYYDLFESQLKIFVYGSLVAQSEVIINQIQLQIDAGIRYESEVLLAKSNKNHLMVEMLSAQKEYNNSSAELLKLLNITDAVKVVCKDSVLLPLDYDLTITENEDSAFLNRPEIKAYEFEIAALQMKSKTFTKGLLIPDININTFGSYFGGLNGAVSPMDPVSYPSTTQLYPTSSLNLSFGWNVPIGELIYKGDRNKYAAKMRIKELQKDQFKVEINQEIILAKSNIQTGQEQMEIADEALKFSAEALSQSMERQKLGTAQPFELFQSQQFYLKAQLDYLKSVTEFNKAQFSLKYAKGSPF